MKKLILLLLVSLIGYFANAQVYDYQVQAASILQADNYFVWQGDTIRKDSLVYAEDKIDSIRFHYINGNKTRWYWNKLATKTYINGKVSNEAYSGTWNGVSLIAPSKDAIFDKITTLEAVNYCASSMTVNTGTLVQGTVTDLCAVGGTDVIIQERVANPPFQVTFTFTGVQRLSGFKIYGRYAGGASHNVHIEAYNYLTASWDYMGEISSTVSKQWFSYSMNLANSYLSSNTVQVRIVHQDSGIINHQLILDYINVNFGGGGGSGFVTAGAVEYTPNGTIAATNVQAAIQELDNEKIAKVTSTDNAIVRFDGTTGNVQNSGVTIDDSNNINIPTSSEYRINSGSIIVDVINNGVTTTAPSQNAVFDALALKEPVNANIQQHITNDSDLNSSNEIQTLTYIPSSRLLDISLSATDVTMPLADAVNAGLMSAADYSKLSAFGANTIYRLKADTVNLSGTASNYDVSLKIPLTQKGENNGVATLDAGGKVPFSQLPATLMIYKGMWSPLTNTPTLSDGMGVSGWVYRSDGNAVINLGSGNLNIYDGDYIIHNGLIWETSTGTDKVYSVNGQQGVVSLDTDDIAEGLTNKYYTDTRSRAAISETVTGLDYNNTTGVLSTTSGYGIPTTTQLNNSHALDADKQTISKTGTTLSGLQIALDRSGGSITLPDEADGSTSNELNTSVGWDNSTNTVSVVDAGGTKSAVITGFLESEVDGSTSNELQTLSNTSDATSHTSTLSNSGGSLKVVEGSGITLTTTGTTLDGIVTIANSGIITEVDGSISNEKNTSMGWDNSTNTVSVVDPQGTVSTIITGFLEAEVDGSTTNEIQDLSLSDNTLSLSSDATSVDISQATAVLANTAKVTNATHSGDASGATTLTLATVNSNIGTYNNVTINAKGLATAGSNISYLTSEADGSITNEGQLTVAAGTGTTSVINSNTSGQTGVTLSVDGTNLGISETGNTISLSNLKPDQTVSLANSTAISVTGTYPSFTIANTAPNVTTDLSVSGTSSPLTLNSSDGTDVTITAGTGITLAGTSGGITITNNSPNIVDGDGNTGNEYNTSMGWNNTTNKVSVIDGGGTKDVEITGFLEAEVDPKYALDSAYIKGHIRTDLDKSTSNELQTISTTGAAGNITLSNNGGTLNLNVNDADANSSNEIQDLSLSGNTLSLSSDATTVDLSAYVNPDVTVYKLKSDSTANTGYATQFDLLSYPKKANNETISGLWNFATAPTILGNSIWHSGNFNPADKAPVSPSGNYVQVSPANAQVGNIWMEGSGTFADVGYGRAIFFDTYSANYGSAMYIGADAGGSNQRVYRLSNQYNSGGTDFVIDYSSNGLPYGSEFSTHTYVERFRLDKAGAATFASTVSATQFQSTIATGTAPLTVASTTMVSNLNANYLEKLLKAWGTDPAPTTYEANKVSAFLTDGITAVGTGNWMSGINVSTLATNVLNSWQLFSWEGGDTFTDEWYFRRGIATWGTPRRIYHSGNLPNPVSGTGTINNIPKWGTTTSLAPSSLVDLSNGVQIEKNSPLINLIDGRAYEGLADGSDVGGIVFNSHYGVFSRYFKTRARWASTGSLIGDIGIGYTDANGTNFDAITINGSNNVILPSTTPSTSPITGALTVAGGLGVGGNGHFGGNIDGLEGYFNGRLVNTGYLQIGTHTYIFSDKYIYFDNGVSNDFSIGKTGLNMTYFSSGSHLFNSTIQAPTAKFTTNAGTGKIFTSDAVGNADWQTVNQVIGGNGLTSGYLPYWDGGKLVNSKWYESNGKLYQYSNAGYIVGQGQLNVASNVNSSAFISVWQPGVSEALFGSKQGDTRTYITNNYHGVGLGSPLKSIWVGTEGDFSVGSLASSSTRLVTSSSTGQLANIADGTAGQFLKTDGAGVYSFATLALTTADVTSSTDKRYVTDAQLAVIGNTSGTNTGDETQSSIITKLGTNDNDVANEGSLSVLSGASNTSLIHSNTIGSTDVTIQVSTGLSISESGNTIVLTNTQTGLTDGAITYERLSTTMTGKQTVTSTIDFNASGIGEISLAGNTTFSFTNLRLNKIFKLKIVTNGYTVTLPTYCKNVVGSQTITGSGTFYLYLDCWNSTGGSEEVLLNTVKLQ